MGKYREHFMSEIERLLPGLLDQIEGIWENIGVSPEECQRRTDHLVQCARGSISKAVEIYDDEYNKLVLNIEHVGKQILALASDLGIETKEPDERLSVLQLEEFLLNYLDELHSEKSRRLDAFKTLTLEEKQLTTCLDWPHSAPCCGTIPTDKQLYLLRAHITEMRTEKDRRYCTFSALKGIIVRLFKTLELTPTEHECDVVNADDDFPLTTSSLDVLKALKEKLEADMQIKIAEAEKLRGRLITLWDLLDVPMEEKEMFLANNMGHSCSIILSLKEEINKMEKRKMDNIQVLICSLREEIPIFWEKCLYSTNQKDAFQQFYVDTLSEEVLEAHENYLKNLKKLYSECHSVFEKVLRLRDLFQKLIAFVTKKDVNPERFNNRGGGLLKEEKERRTLQVQIPKLEKEIQEAVLKWESEHSMRLTVFGQSLSNYLQSLWDIYNNEKEKERLERQMKKTRVFEEMSKGVGFSPSLGKRAWVPTSSPLSARTNKMLKQIPMSITSCKTPLAAINRISSSSIPTKIPKTCSMPLGKPPQSSKKTPIIRKMEPRRLLQKAALTTPKLTENSIVTQPMLNPADVRDIQVLGTSTLSTYTEFENKLSSKCRIDTNSRSSTVTPCSPVPGSPRKCRGRLGLPMLI